MSTERKLSNSLLLVVLLALSAYNLYSVITLKEEVASLKGETVQSEETVTPEPAAHFRQGAGHVAF